MTVEVDIWSHSEENSDLGPTVQSLPYQPGYQHGAMLILRGRVWVSIKGLYGISLITSISCKYVSRLVHSESHVVTRCDGVAAEVAD